MPTENSEFRMVLRFDEPQMQREAARASDSIARGQATSRPSVPDGGAPARRFMADTKLKDASEAGERAYQGAKDAVVNSLSAVPVLGGLAKGVAAGLGAARALKQDAASIIAQYADVDPGFAKVQAQIEVARFRARRATAQTFSAAQLPKLGNIVTGYDQAQEELLSGVLRTVLHRGDGSATPGPSGGGATSQPSSTPSPTPLPQQQPEDGGGITESRNISFHRSATSTPSFVRSGPPPISHGADASLSVEVRCEDDIHKVIEQFRSILWRRFNEATDQTRQLSNLLIGRAVGGIL